MSEEYNNTIDNQSQRSDLISENEKLSKRVAELEKQLDLLENNSINGNDAKQIVSEKEVDENSDIPVTDGLLTLYKLSAEELASICSSEKRISTPITNFRMESYNGERTIRKYVGKEEFVCIPDGVTSIGKKAFQRCTHLKSIVIPDTVTRIGNEAFSECTNLKSATISSSVTAIGDAAFNSCIDLMSISIPESVESIGKCVFYDCKSLVSISIPNSISTIRRYMFYNCTSLSSVTLGSITDIANSAFSGCTSLISITLPSSVKSVAKDAFRGCKKLVSIAVDSMNNDHCSINGVLYNKAKTVLELCPCGKSSITIPDGVSVISNGAFFDCSNIKTVFIPNSVTAIENEAFANCTSLTSISIPNSVKTISYKAFYGCTSLREITIPDSVASIGDLAFDSCKILTIYCNSGSTVEQYAQRNGIAFKLLNASAKSNKTGTDNKKRSETVADFEIDFYKNERRLKRYVGKGSTAYIPDDITSIGREAFFNCTYLSNVVIPNSVACICENSFWNCTGLKSITLPASVSSIAADAFLGCINLENVSVDSNNQYYCSFDGVLYNKNKTKLIMCPGNMTRIAFPVGLTWIGEYSFSNWKNITWIILPEGIKSILDKAFYGCSRLTGAIIPDSVMTIAEDAFQGCSSLTIYGNKGSKAEKYANEHSIPFRTEFINDVSSNSTPLSDFKIKAVKGGQVLKKYVGKSETVVIPETITRIGSGAFWCCKKITSITIQNGVTDIGDNAFTNCICLRSVILPKSLVSIGNESFRTCTALTDIIIPDGVKSINVKTFYGCTNLTSITIPSSVISIGRNAFSWCGHLSPIGHLTIKCFKDSTAHRYAEKHGIAYRLID